MIRLSSELHIKLASLTPVFEAAAKDGKSLYYPFDTHWNSTGREIAAAFMTSVLRKEVELQRRHPDICRMRSIMQAVTQTAPRDAGKKNTDKPLVSVIIIFLNEERFSREAIESVFAQTYENWELLLVDDGSTDASTKIARRYAEQYPERVRYLEHDGHQ